MSVHYAEDAKLRKFDETGPEVTIFLRPIAPPAALALAANSSALWIVGTWLANWWGLSTVPYYFAPMIFFWGGLAQFIAGVYGFAARDTFVTVVHTLWGAFWLSFGFVAFLIVATALPARDFKLHFSELAAWTTITMAFSWVAAIAAMSRDAIIAAHFFSIALGSTLTTAGWYRWGSVAGATVKAGGYFFILAALLGWYRVSAFLLDEAYGLKYRRMYPIWRAHSEIEHDLAQPGLGEPGVKRSMPGMI